MGKYLAALWESGEGTEPGPFGRGGVRERACFN